MYIHDSTRLEKFKIIFNTSLKVEILLVTDPTRETIRIYYSAKTHYETLDYSD